MQDIRIKNGKATMKIEKPLVLGLGAIGSLVATLLVRDGMDVVGSSEKPCKAGRPDLRSGQIKATFSVHGVFAKGHD